MSVEFRSPNLSGRTPEDQLRQLLSFLRQHIQQLNWVLRNLDETRQDTLTQEQAKAVTDTVSRSAEVFQTLCRKLKRKQAQENFLTAKRTVFQGVSLGQGDTAPADTEAVSRYTLFAVVTGGSPVVCARLGDVISGGGVMLTCGSGDVTVTAAESPVTALYAVV